MIALYIALGLIAVLLAVVLIRTAMFKPYKVETTPNEEVSVDKDTVVKNLQTLVKFKTVSNADHSLEDDKEFEGLINELPNLFPNVFKVCEFSRFPDRGLLFRWKGKENGNPAVMMAHYDVVPVEEESWEKPPFAGVVEDGVLWGRGTLDTKITFSSILTAADKLISEGYTPKNDMYFAFSGGEEVNGPGAVNIVNYFAEKGIEPELVIDEGGAVVENMFPGVKEPCGLIGIAEKGMLNLSFDLKSNGGHASAPKPHTPVGELSQACCNVENHPFASHVTKPVHEMFDNLGRHSTFVYRMIFANMWLFKGVLDGICKKSGGELNALMRTTVAFTQMEGSKAPNVIPPSVKMVANIRLNPQDTMDSAVEYIKKTINNDDVKVSVMEGMNPSRISRTDCLGWQIVKNAVADTWKGCIVSPYLMVQCSDSRHYGKISDRVYRFSAMDLTAEERKTIHGNNERIRVDCAARACEFYIRVMKQC